MATLVGRESHVFRLSAAWGAATRGRCALVLLAGAAGIGKTSLAGETERLAAATGGTVLRAHCRPGERSMSLRPLVDALGPRLAARWAGGQTAHEAVAGAVRGAAADRPVLLVLDDLHHAGLATVELLRGLLDSSRTRLLVIAAVRTPEGDPTLDALAAVATRLDVGPLPPPAVAQLAADAGHAAAAAPVRERTGGHPLFVAEALRALSAGDELPESLESALLTRVGDHAELLRAASVLGGTVDPATLARLVDLPLPVTARHCAAALSAGLLTAAGRGYEFSHDLVREALYASIPAPERRALHARAADLLAHRPEVLARHAEAAGDRARAAGAWLQAGAEAARHGADADARALFAAAEQGARLAPTARGPGA